MNPRPLRLGTLLGWAALASCAGCAHAPPGRTSHLETRIGAFELVFPVGDEGVAQQVSEALTRNAPRLSEWGALRETVRVEIVATHQELEEDIGRKGYPWLRAWARYQDVILQSPRSWGGSSSDERLIDELLVHEVTHCLMYQRSAQADTWMSKGIPLWFREGMASTTALQGYRRGSLEDLQHYLLVNPGSDPIGDGEAMVQRQSEVVYAAAHQAFQFLEDRYGVPSVRAIMDAMASGLTFDDAFTRTLGVSRTGFERDFTEWVRLGGWKRAHGPPTASQAP